MIGVTLVNVKNLHKNAPYPGFYSFLVPDFCPLQLDHPLRINLGCCDFCLLALGSFSTDNLCKLKQSFHSEQLLHGIETVNTCYLVSKVQMQKITLDHSENYPIFSMFKSGGLLLPHIEDLLVKFFLVTYL